MADVLETSLGLDILSNPTIQRAVAVELLRAAKVAVEVKSRYMRRDIRRMTSKTVHLQLTNKTEMEIRRVLEPFFKQQVESIAHNLERSEKSKNALIRIAKALEDCSDPGIKINIPLIRQKNDYYCGPACLLSVISYFQSTDPLPTQDEIADAAGTSEITGTHPTGIVRAANDYWIEANVQQNLTIDQVKEFVDAVNPVIVNIQAWSDQNSYDEMNDGHYIVVVGYDDTKLFFMDPSIDNELGWLSNEEFLDRWYDKTASGEVTHKLGIVLSYTNKEQSNGKSRHTRQSDDQHPANGSEYGAQCESTLLVPSSILEGCECSEVGRDVFERTRGREGSCSISSRSNDIVGGSTNIAAFKGTRDSRNIEESVRGGSSWRDCSCKHLHQMGEISIGPPRLRDHGRAEEDIRRDGRSCELAARGTVCHVLDGRTSLLRKMDVRSATKDLLNTKEWTKKLVDRLLPTMAVSMARSAIAQFLEMGIDIRRSNKNRRKSINIHTKSTASDWLDQNPDDLDEFESIMESSGVSGYTVVLSLPDSMKERVVRLLNRSFSQEYWEGISETTGGAANRILEQGLQEGWSIRDMAKQIREALGGDDYARTRSFNIARTESGNALNGAREEVYNELKFDFPSVPMRKVWLSVKGPTTRPEHADLDGVPADEDGLWELDGQMIPWPGHYSLDPGMRCNCQCTIITEIGLGDDESRQMIEDYYQRMEDEENV